MDREIQDIVISIPPPPPVWRGEVDITGCPVDENVVPAVDPEAILAHYHDTLPTCPDCGEKITKAIQGIMRSGEILRVDGHGNLELKEYEEYSYAASVLLECDCGSVFRPQDDVETYSQKESVKLYDIPQRVENDSTSFDGSLFW